jgi:hypothetical protein
MSRRVVSIGTAPGVLPDDCPPAQPAAGANPSEYKAGGTECSTRTGARRTCPRLPRTAAGGAGAARHGPRGRAVRLGGRRDPGGEIRRHARGGPGGPPRKIPVLQAWLRLPAGRPADPADASGAQGEACRIAAGRTASGSVRVAGQRAQVAKASRIWVEGKHDAELVEKVWGDDLRVEGIVVEPLHGIDDLTAAVASFPPRSRAAGLASWWTTWSQIPRSPGSPTR